MEQSPLLLWSPKVHYRFHNSPTLVRILSQINPAHTLTTYFFKVHFNIILPSTPVFKLVSSLHIFLPKLHMHLCHACYMYRPSHPLTSSP